MPHDTDTSEPFVISAFYLFARSLTINIVCVLSLWLNIKFQKVVWLETFHKLITLHVDLHHVCFVPFSGR